MEQFSFLSCCALRATKKVSKLVIIFFGQYIVPGCTVDECLNWYLDSLRLSVQTVVEGVGLH